MRTIPAILHESVERCPERAAIIATRGGRDRRLTFSSLEQASELFARQLEKSGIRKSDPVLVFVPMSIELYIALLGIFRIGAIATFLDPSAGLKHINACCKMLPPTALVGAWPLRFARPFVSGLRRIPRVFAPPQPSMTIDPEHSSIPACSPDDPALITFTSGSTGHPKAAVRTHEFLVAQHEALRSSIQLEEGEVDLTTLPIFVLANLASGITSVLPEGKISRPGSIEAAPVARQIHRLRTTRTGGSPAFYLRLANEPGCLADFRKIYTGGAPVFPSVLRRLQQCAPRANVVAVYGSTEAEPIAHISCHEIQPADWQAMQAGKGLLVGKPIPQTTLRVIPDQWGRPVTTDQQLAHGQIGEIVVTGGHVLKGYLHGLGNEETKFQSESQTWHRTGDAGYLDESGRLWLMGRCAARVQDAEGVLYPFAVECVGMTFDFIKRVAFVAKDGQRILAVEGTRRLEADEIAEIEKALIWARLDRVKIFARIPVDARHNSKIDYPALRKMLRR